MATTSNETPNATTGKVLKLSIAAQKIVVEFANTVLTAHKQNDQLQSKMDAIDEAYARYKVASSTSTNGVDPIRSEAPCGNVFADDSVTPPLVVSQVDSYTAYLADVFLSGYPLFPVASNPSNKIYAEQLETLLDDHANLGGYVRQLLLFLRDGVKYNYSAIECEWDSIDQFSIVGDFESGTGRKVDRSKKYFTKIKRLNMRNVVRDTDVPVGDIAEQGDYAGYIELISKTKLKRLLNKLTASNDVYNADKAVVGSVSYASNNFREDPTISDYVTNMGIGKNGVNWDAYFDPESKGHKGPSYGTTYEKFTLYARIMPSEFGISAPQKNTPQIWKFVIINGSIMISANRIISAYDYLPILFGQPLEDGLGYQTQSVAEAEIPFQSAASTLFNIRFASARRAVSDRALYDPAFITAQDANARGPAPKIPVRIGQLSNKTLKDVYQQVPFDNRGLENVISDAQTIVGFSKELHGMNGPRQGQFQKGNKSVSEWDDTMAASNNRLRLPALCLEHQVFSPLKSILTLNIFQYGDDAVVISQKSGQVIKIDLAKLRAQVLAFKIADGITPKSKLASTEAIAGILTLISTSQILQQSYGNRLPAMVAHLAQLQGVKGLEEYDPNYQTAQAPQGLQQAAIASPMPPQQPAMMPPEGMDPSMMQAPMPSPGIP
jgi:hypothetical protein